MRFSKSSVVVWLLIAVGSFPLQAGRPFERMAAGEGRVTGIECPQPPLIRPTFQGIPGCSEFAEANPVIRMTFEVTRVVGLAAPPSVDSTGAIINLSELVANGVVAPRHRLKLVWPISPLPPVCLGCGTIKFEHRVVLNGAGVAGFESSWANAGSEMEVEFEVDASLIRFAIPGPFGAPPTPGQNTLEILTNAGGAFEPCYYAQCGLEYWWGLDASLTIDALYPIVMVHGWRSSPDGISQRRFNPPNPDWIGVPMEAKRVPFVFRRIELGKQSSIRQGGQTLASLIPRVLIQYGVDRLHLPAHSKGGLYARYVLRQLTRKAGADMGYGRFGVISLVTVNTPHHGSTGAQAMFALKVVPTGWGKLLSGLHDLGPIDVMLFNKMTGAPPSSITICGDHCGQPLESDPVVQVTSRYTKAHADLNGDWELTRNASGQDELEGYSGGEGGLMAMMFQFTGSPVGLKTLNSLLGLIPKFPVIPWGFKKNDAVVTTTSAEFTGFANLPSQSANAVFARNHGTMLRQDNADLILNAIRAAQPAGGYLR